MAAILRVIAKWGAVLAITAGLASCATTGPRRRAQGKRSTKSRLQREPHPRAV